MLRLAFIVFILGSKAHAATLTLDFVSGIGTRVDDSSPDVMSFPETAPPVTAQLVFEFQQLQNQSYSARFGGGTLFDVTATTGLHLVNARIDFTEWQDALFGGIRVTTDNQGELDLIGFSLATDTPDYVIAGNAARWGTASDIVYTFEPGTWTKSTTVAAIPLPSSITLLCLGLLGITALNRPKRSQH